MLPYLISSQRLIKYGCVPVRSNLNEIGYLARNTVIWLLSAEEVKFVLAVPQTVKMIELQHALVSVIKFHHIITYCE